MSFGSLYDCYSVKELFTAAYNTPDFSYAIIQYISDELYNKLNNILEAFEFNDVARYFQITISKDNNLSLSDVYAIIKNILSNFIIYAGTDARCRELLYLINADKYKNFINGIQKIDKNNLNTMTDTIFTILNLTNNQNENQKYIIRIVL